MPEVTLHSFIILLPFSTVAFVFVPQQLRLERWNKKREFAGYERQKEGVMEQLRKRNLYQKEVETILKNVRLGKQGKINVFKKSYSKLNMNLS